MFDECQNQGLEYSNRDSCDCMLRQGIMLLTDSARTIVSMSTTLDGICRSNSPGQLPKRTTSSAYIDAIGKLDGTRCLLGWKTTSSRYPEEPDGLPSLDPQLVCYSWMTGIAEIAQMVSSENAWLRFSTCALPLPDER